MLTTVLSIIMWLPAKLMNMLPAFAKLGFLSGMFNPVLGVIGSIFQFFASPVGRWVLLAACIVGAFLIGDLHGHVHEHSHMVAVNKEETARAVKEAVAARTAAEQKFDHGRFNNRPSVLPGRVRHGSDGFSRD